MVWGRVFCLSVILLAFAVAFMNKKVHYAGNLLSLSYFRTAVSYYLGISFFFFFFDGMPGRISEAFGEFLPVCHRVLACARELNQPKFVIYHLF